jgi:hypothetical protein
VTATPKSEGNDAERAARLQIGEEFFHRLIKEDEPIMKTIRFHDGLLIDADRALARSFNTCGGFQLRGRSQPEQKEGYQYEGVDSFGRLPWRSLLREPAQLPRSLTRQQSAQTGSSKGLRSRVSVTHRPTLKPPTTTIWRRRSRRHSRIVTT